ATEVFGAVAAYRSGIVDREARAPHVPEGPPGGGPVVTFSRSDLAVPWDDRYPSLLDLAEACDVPVGFGCRNGTWHNCASGLLRLVRGVVTRRAGRQRLRLRDERVGRELADARVDLRVALRQLGRRGERTRRPRERLRDHPPVRPVVVAQADQVQHGRPDVGL